MRRDKGGLLETYDKTKLEPKSNVPTKGVVMREGHEACECLKAGESRTTRCAATIAPKRWRPMYGSTLG